MKLKKGWRTAESESCLGLFEGLLCLGLGFLQGRRLQPSYRNRGKSNCTIFTLLSLSLWGIYMMNFLSLEESSNTSSISAFIIKKTKTVPYIISVYILAKNVCSKKEIGLNLSKILVLFIEVLSLNYWRMMYTGDLRPFWNHWKKIFRTMWEVMSSRCWRQCGHFNNQIHNRKKNKYIQKG